MRRTILVTGATGKQGSGLIRALLQSSPASESSQSHEYHILALTRNSSSATSQHLSSLSLNITLVEGDLDNPDSITKIFENSKSEGGIWGVFAVLAFPGLGANADGEERQGFLLADLAFQYQVQSFIYSSSFRAGEKYEAELELSGAAKRNIELRCRELGKRGLAWTILRPGFFLENLDGFIGSISATILKKGLKPDTEVGFIASEDIGRVAASVFHNPQKYHQKILAVISEFLTLPQLYSSHVAATGRPIPTIPSSFGWLILKMNKMTQKLIEHCETVHRARTSGEYPSWEEEWGLAKEAAGMRSCFEWFKEKGGDGKGEEKDWNKVSVGKLLVGRS